MESIPHAYENDLSSRGIGSYQTAPITCSSVTSGKIHLSQESTYGLSQGLSPNRRKSLLINDFSLRSAIIMVLRVTRVTRLRV